MTTRFYLEMRRHFYTTPSSYLDLLHLYKFMLKQKNMEIKQARERITNGLSKLYSTNSVVDSMKEELTKMEPIIKAKNQNVAELVQTIAKQQIEGDKVKKVVERDEAAARVSKTPRPLDHYDPET